MVDRQLGPQNAGNAGDSTETPQSPSKPVVRGAGSNSHYTKQVNNLI